MDIGKVVAGVLSSDVAVTAIVADKISPNLIPQAEKLPAITYFIVSGSEIACLEESNMDVLIVQISCYSRTVKDCVALQMAVRNALREYSGNEYGVSVQNTKVNGFGDLPGNSTIYGKRIDFKFFVNT